MQSTQTRRFDRIPNANIPRSSFDRSHGHKTTIDAGLLYPIFVDEALPGDTHAVKMAAFGRLSTPLKPLMDNMHLETFFFSVPIRLLWDNWTKFNGEQTNPNDSTDYIVPQIKPDPAQLSNGFPPGSLADHIGLPTGVANISVSSLYHRAYNKIWNEWFRDQNLQDSAVDNTGDGPDDVNDYPLRRRGKRHDYFTSCLPFPQKGEAATVSIGGTAPVVEDRSNVAQGSNVPTFREYLDAVELGALRSGVANDSVRTFIDGIDGLPLQWVRTGLIADLSGADGQTINDIREAFQIQKMFERDARGGTRYPEVIKSHFGVTHPDQSWRSEYLGGGSSPINITPVPNTTGAFGKVQGELAGYGTMSVNNHGFTKSFTEHCIVMGFINVRADITYQQGLNRRFDRKTRFDHFWPALQGLGEQEVLNSEIFASANVSQNAEVFGYQERYAEYRYSPSIITGKFRSNDPLSLDVWHLAQDFATLPTLSDEFIQDNPPIDRVVAVPSEPHFIVDTYFKVRSARPMPTYGVPGMIDHF